jgi:opacity protein-like surface antigen
MAFPHLRIWTGLILLAGPLQAAQDSGPLHFGLQATLASSRQDPRNLGAASAFGGGLFVEQDLPDAVTLRSRFDYLAFGRTPAGASFNQASLGGEVRYAPPALKGFFILGGALGTRLETKAPAQADPGAPAPPEVAKDKTSFKFGVAAGAGYRLAGSTTLTVRYTLTNLDAIRWATLEGGLDIRF